MTDMVSVTDMVNAHKTCNRGYRASSIRCVLVDKGNTRQKSYVIEGVLVGFHTTPESACDRSEKACSSVAKWKMENLSHV